MAKLDPRELTGVQPHPEDIRFKLNPGKTFSLGPAVPPTDFIDQPYDNVQNQSEFITEWTVKILPPAETVAQVAAGEGYGMRVQLLANYHGDQFTEYQPADNPAYLPLTIPIVGQVIGVHGRFINCRIDRNDPGATGKLKIQAAIVPGRPSRSEINRTIGLTPAVEGAVNIPTFATRFCVFGSFVAGDTVNQRSPGGGSVQLIAWLPDYVGRWLPISPEASAISYLSAGPGKTIVVGFEIIS